jgi:drug/metabolite transporter (DMT)-like permease
MGLPPRVVLAVAATIFFWSSSFPAIRIGLEGYGPVELTAFRYFAASALLAPISLLRRLPLPRSTDIPSMFLLGVLGIAVYHLLLSFGQQTISAGAAGVLSNTSPIFTAILAAVFLGERLHAVGWIGITVAFLGACLIAAGSEERFHLDTGAILVLMAAVTWSLYFTGQKKLLERYNAFDLITFVIWMGTIPLLFFSPSVLLALQSASAKSTISVVYLGTFPTIVAYAAWAYVLSRMPASVAASALYGVPILAMMLSWLVLGEVPTTTMIIGAVLATSGVIIVNSFGRKSD